MRDRSHSAQSAQLRLPRVLFIGPRTFGYEEEIVREIRLAGYDVDWFDERPSSSSFVKALIRVNPLLAAPLSNVYFDRIIRRASGSDYSVVFVIKGEGLSEGKLLQLRRAMPNVRFIYYTWDSLRNVKGAANKLRYFDSVYSFDRLDHLADSRIRHLPLFYTRAYEKLARDSSVGEPSDIDLLSLASLHSDRYGVSQKIFRAALRTLPTAKIYDYYYFQSRWIFALRKFGDPGFSSIPWSKVRWAPLSREESVSLVSKSRVLVDVPHPRQSGLTMRMIEAIGAKKKIITTNPEVKNYDFYDPENILIVDRDNPTIPAEFIRRPYVSIDSDVYARYNLRNWIRVMFSDNGTSFRDIPGKLLPEQNTGKAV